MFSNSKKETVIKTGNDHKIDTFIGPTASIKGDISSEGNIRVDGTFYGNIISKGEVVIGETAVFTGNITSSAVIIFGMVKGNIKSDGRLEIMSTGKLYGDIDVKTVSIKEGAVFKGQSLMNEENETSLAEKEAAATI